ncbi:hypothetical protein [Actinomadura hibisca]|uniref:hypothetical protein n=1 Tax=Actinomadura hibisca TaxID=68565 RepID=UPI0008295D52|nr:hypothetical protein [Actinomadura hibisca]
MSAQRPAPHESAEQPTLGRVAQVHGLTTDGTWIKARDAFDITKVHTGVLAIWAGRGVISARRVGRDRRREYLREELRIVAGLGAGGPLRLPRVMKHIKAQERRGSA